MSKHLAFALVIAAAGLAAPAWSQPAPAPRPSGTVPAQPGQPGKPDAPPMGQPMGPMMGQPGAMPHPGMGPGPMGMHADMPPPRHWMHGEAAWNRHVELCLKRFRTYNPKTDRYIPRRGITRRCRL